MRGPAVLLAVAFLLAGCTAEPKSEQQLGPSPTPNVSTPALPSMMAWREAPPMPTPRVEHCAALVGSVFYVIGGYIIANPVSLPGPAGGVPTGPPTNRVDRFDAKTEQWTLGPAYPTPLDHCLAVGFEDAVYVFYRGQAGASYQLPAGGSQWIKIADPPNGHNAGVAAVLGDRIYATGGSSAELDVYDPASDSWETHAANLPTRRDHTTGAVVEGRFYVVAGDVGGHSENTGANEMFDPTTNQWANRTPVPVVRGSVSGVSWHGHVLVMGGQDGRTNVAALSDVNAYDPQTDNWTALPAMPSGRHGFASGVWNDKVYVFAGAPQMGVSGFEKVHVLEAA